MKKIFINCDFKNKEDVIGNVIQSFEKLKINYKYLSTFKEREDMISFNIGNLIAIPHGTYEGAQYIEKSEIIIYHLEKPIFWDYSDVQIVIGLAVKANDQLSVLKNIAINSMNENLFNDILKNPTLKKLENFTKEQEEWT